MMMKTKKNVKVSVTNLVVVVIVKNLVTKVMQVMGVVLLIAAIIIETSLIKVYVDSKNILPATSRNLYTNWVPPILTSFLENLKLK